MLAHEPRVSYGFIESETVKAQFGRDAFFHRTKLPEGVFEALQPGMPVRAGRDLQDRERSGLTIKMPYETFSTLKYHTDYSVRKSQTPSMLSRRSGLREMGDSSAPSPHTEDNGRHAKKCLGDCCTRLRGNKCRGLGLATREQR